MSVKYRNIFTSITGDEIKLDIDIAGYSGDVINIDTIEGQAVTVSRQSENQRLYGIYGTALQATFINVGTIDVLDFLPDSYEDCKATLYVNDVIEFVGFIVMDDITNELRAVPYQFQVTFTDNLALLSDAKPDFPIDNNFVTIISLLRSLLELTGLTLPLNVFHRPYPETESALIGAFESTKVLRRTFAETLQTFKSAKDIINAFCISLRCRLYQHKGEWFMVRQHDYLYGDTLQGFRYNGTDTGVAATYDATPNDGLILLSFSQAVTHKRAVNQVQNKYDFNPGFQLFNADLQDLGTLVSETVVGDNTVSRYNIPSYWVLDGSMTAFIEVVRETATDTEVDRYLLLPYLNAAQFGPDGIRFNSILCSRGDGFNLTLSSTAQSNSNFAAKFLFGVLFEGASGTNYTLDIPGLSGKLVWEVTTDTPSTVDTVIWVKEVPGSADNTDEQEFFIRGSDQGIEQFPEDGFLHIKIGAYKNNTARQADLTAEIRDLELTYNFLVNKSLLITGQTHTADNTANTLNEVQQDIELDQSIKFSAIGNFYDLDNLKVTGFIYPNSINGIRISELNVTEEAQITGLTRRVIDGIFMGEFDMPDQWSFDGSTWWPTRLSRNYRNGQFEAEFTEVKDAAGVDYNFKYLYKIRE